VSSYLALKLLKIETMNQAKQPEFSPTPRVCMSNCVWA